MSYIKAWPYAWWEKGQTDKEGHKERVVSSGVEGVGSAQAERIGKGIGTWMG